MVRNFNCGINSVLITAVYSVKYCSCQSSGKGILSTKEAIMDGSVEKGKFFLSGIEDQNENNWKQLRKWVSRHRLGIKDARGIFLVNSNKMTRHATSGMQMYLAANEYWRCTSCFSSSGVCLPVFLCSAVVVSSSSQDLLQRETHCIMFKRLFYHLTLSNFS